MPVQYDVYQDTFFLKGIEEGRKSGMEEEKKRAAEREKKAIIRLCELGISAEKIVAAFAIPLERVRKVILDWENENIQNN